MSPHNAPMTPEGATDTTGLYSDGDHATHDLVDVDADREHLRRTLRDPDCDPQLVAEVRALLEGGLLDVEIAEWLDEGGHLPRDEPEPADEDKRDPNRYARPTRAIVRALSKCPDCLVLYDWLDIEIGGQLSWSRTIAAAAKDLEWQTRTVTKHAEHLAARRMITLSRYGANASQRMHLRYQPARRLGLGDVDLSRIPAGARATRRGTRNAHTIPTGTRSAHTSRDQALTKVGFWATDASTDDGNGDHEENS